MIVQTAETEKYADLTREMIIDDGVIPKETSLAHPLLSTPSKKKFIGIPELHV